VETLPVLSHIKSVGSIVEFFPTKNPLIPIKYECRNHRHLWKYKVTGHDKIIDENGYITLEMILQAVSCECVLE